MEFVTRRLEGLYDVHYTPIVDHRGSLIRVFNADLFEPIAGHVDWSQNLFSYTKKKNIIRGLYIQRAPLTEAKLVAPVTGTVFWVVVDLRRGSPTFGQWEGSLISPEDHRALYVPRGLANGHLSMTDDVLINLLADRRHSDRLGVGIRWDDPELAIEWPELEGPRVLSDAHAAYPDFKSFRETVGGL